MISIIQNGQYTLNATAKTILFTDTTIKKENILKIRDVDHNCLIYDSESPISGRNISLDGSTPGLFHFDYTGVVAGSTLQIIYDSPILVDGGTP